MGKPVPYSFNPSTSCLLKENYERDSLLRRLRIIYTARQFAAAASRADRSSLMKERTPTAIYWRLGK